MQVVELPVARVRGTEYNPRIISKDQLAHLAASMKRFGVVDPIVVNRRSGKHWNGSKRGDVVVGGHQRLRVVREAGKKTIPAVLVRLAPDNEKLLNLALNRIGGEFDLQKLAGIFKELRGAKSKLEGTGFDERQLEIAIHQAQLELGASMGGVAGEDDAPGLPGKAKTHPGSIITLGRHRLMCGDSTDPEQVKALMRGKRSPLLSTDPPYMVGYDEKKRPPGRRRVWRTFDPASDSTGLLDKYLAAALACALSERPAIYQWYAHMSCSLVHAAWAKNGLKEHQQIIWVKHRPTINRQHFMWDHEPCSYGFVGGRQPHRRPPKSTCTVWEIKRDNNREYVHPTQKPVELFRRPILWHTAPGDVVYEPFAGSGSQLIAAELTGRTCYAMEISPGFCDVIRERYAQVAHANGNRNSNGKQKAKKTAPRRS